MSDDISTSYTPLYDPETDASPAALPVDLVLNSAREILDKVAAANIHDKQEMIRAAVSLEMTLRQLVAAIDKKAGR